MAHFSGIFTQGLVCQTVIGNGATNGKG